MNEGVFGSEISANQLDYVQIDDGLIDQAIQALNAVRREGFKLAVAESCTGGLIATVLSEAPGAAEHFEGGYIVYTPEQKTCALKISLPRPNLEMAKRSIPIRRPSTVDRLQGLRCRA
jgi:hypothetical protein